MLLPFPLLLLPIGRIGSIAGSILGQTIMRSLAALILGEILPFELAQDSADSNAAFILS